MNLCKDTVRRVRGKRKVVSFVMQPLLYASHHGMDHGLRNLMLLQKESELGKESIAGSAGVVGGALEEVMPCFWSM